MANILEQLTRKDTSDFVREHQIEITATRIPARADIDMSGWGKDASHWHITFRQVGRGNNRTMTTYYIMGSAYKHKPTAADVLDCLASDASGYDNARNFEDWASEYGYDTDSRKAYGTYQILGEQAKQLRQWLGNAAYTQLTEQTERL